MMFICTSCASDHEAIDATSEGTEQMLSPDVVALSPSGNIFPTLEDARYATTEPIQNICA